jgi:outer membrane protein, multidrug efflux system
VAARFDSGTRAQRGAWAAIAIAAAMTLLSGCALGPDFVKPDPPMPTEYRGEIEPVEALSFADAPWWDVFHDEILRGLIDEALANNYDLRTAIYRVRAAQQQVGITRSPLFPAVSYQGDASRQRVFISPQFPNTTFNSFLGSFNLAWEIDLWGRIRRSTESSLADMMAEEDVRRGVVLSLVSTVAQSYFTLQELDLELAIARSTAESFTETLALFDRRYLGGVDSKLSVERAKAALYDTTAAIPQLEQQIVVQENQLCALLGRQPGPITRAPMLTQQAVTPDTPAGLPAELLVRRPDILQAEQQIASSNALIGVSVANFFPRIGITALYGGQSSEIENIVKGPGAIWTIAGSVLGPLFQGGALIASYRQSLADWEATKQQYMQVVLTALGEVSNALIAQQKQEEARIEQAKAVDALRESVRLAVLRYTGGLASYYEVLEAQQELFPAEITLAQIDLNRLLAVVQLYASLGGGWAATDKPVEAGFWPKGP